MFQTTKVALEDLVEVTPPLKIKGVDAKKMWVLVYNLKGFQYAARPPPNPDFYPKFAKLRWRFMKLRK
jgi:hypothetical protein